MANNSLIELSTLITFFLFISKGCIHNIVIK